MADARASLRRLDAWVSRLTDHAATATAAEPHALADHDRFALALDDDLNISGALGQLFEIVRESNLLLDRGELSPGHARRLLDWWLRINETLAVEPDADANAVPAEVQRLLDARAQARRDKDFRRSDELRAEIAALGWAVKDTKDGQKVTKL
jgi:cysteinyl-tRNA synthetase